MAGKHLDLYNQVLIANEVPANRALLSLQEALGREDLKGVLEALDFCLPGCRALLVGRDVDTILSNDFE